jgi:hypothetical protein
MFIGITPLHRNVTLIVTRLFLYSSARRRFSCVSAYYQSQYHSFGIERQNKIEAYSTIDPYDYIVKACNHNLVIKDRIYVNISILYYQILETNINISVSLFQLINVLHKYCENLRYDIEFYWMIVYSLYPWQKKARDKEKRV